MPRKLTIAHRRRRRRARRRRRGDVRLGRQPQRHDRQRRQGRAGRRRRPDARAGARARSHERLLEPLQQAARRPRRRAGTFPLIGARGAASTPNVDAMVDDGAASAAARAAILARTWRAHQRRRGRRARRRPTSPTPTRAVQRLVDRVRVAVSRSRSTQGRLHAGQRVAIRRVADRPSRSTPRKLRADDRARARLGRPTRPRASRADSSKIQPKVTTEKLAQQVPASSLTVDRGGFRLSLFKKPQARARPTRSPSARPASRRRPASTRSRTRRSTRPGTSRTRPGRASLAGTVIPGGTPQQPAQGALAGRLRRRRRARHRRARLDRHERLARLHPDAHRGRREALRRGAGRHPDLHPLTPRPLRTATAEADADLRRPGSPPSPTRAAGHGAASVE